MTTLVLSVSLLLVTLAPVMLASDWSMGEMESSDWSDQGVSTRRLVELLRRLADIIEDEEDSTRRPRLQTMSFVTPRPSSDW